MIGLQHNTQQIYRLYLSFWQCIDWLFPPLCGGCNANSSRWCRVCQANTDIISAPICEICGSPFGQHSICSSCEINPPHYQHARSWALFNGPLRNAIHRLKYRRDVAMGEMLSRPLIDVLNASHWEIDMVVPIPLGNKRKADRGFNQVDFIARPLALSLNLPYRPKAVRRQRETISQVGLSVHQRRKNVLGAFRANRSLVSGKNVLLVDDVITTGATMDSCAGSLVEAGAQLVYCLSVGRTVMK